MLGANLCEEHSDNRNLPMVSNSNRCHSQRYHCKGEPNHSVRGALAGSKITSLLYQRQICSCCMMSNYGFSKHNLRRTSIKKEQLRVSQKCIKEHHAHGPRDRVKCHSILMQIGESGSASNRLGTEQNSKDKTPSVSTRQLLGLGPSTASSPLKLFLTPL